MKKEFGIQPLDGVLVKLELNNDALVKASTEQLTHKQVQKGRIGRYITPNIKGKIIRALNSLDEKGKYTVKILFNYR